MGGLASVDPSGASILLPEGEYQSCFNVFRSLGNPTNPNHVVVVFTEPGSDTIRIISLRKAVKRERVRYEKALKDRLG